MLIFNKPSKLIIITAVVLASVFYIGCSVNKSDSDKNISLQSEFFYEPLSISMPYKNKASGGVNSSADILTEQCYITLDDIRTIAHNKGENITVGDFRGFIGTDVGSGFYILHYIVDDSDYVLSVSYISNSDMNSVMAAILISTAANGEYEAIDIRYYDVDKFIEFGLKELVRPLPVVKPTSSPSSENHSKSRQ